MNSSHFSVIMPIFLFVSCTNYTTDDPLRQSTLSILTSNGKRRLDRAVEERVKTLNEAKNELRKLDLKLNAAQVELDASDKALSDLRAERRLSQQEFDRLVAERETLERKIREQQARISKLKEREAQQQQTQGFIQEANLISNEVEYLSGLIDSYHQSVMIKFLED